jgi:hypothetical protein
MFYLTFFTLHFVEVADGWNFVEEQRCQSSFDSTPLLAGKITLRALVLGRRVARSTFHLRFWRSTSLDLSSSRQNSILLAGIADAHMRGEPCLLYAYSSCSGKIQDRGEILYCQARTKGDIRGLAGP